MRFFTIALCLCPFIALGQNSEPVSKGYRFHSIFQTGLIHGKKGDAFIAESIFGIQRHSLSAGLGVGIDHYELRSLPLFLDIRKEFGKSANHFFVYGDGGVNLGLLKRKENESFGQLTTKNTSAGIYAAAGLGVKFGLPRKQAVAFSMGYSRKALKLTMYDQRSWMTAYEDIATYRYSFQRLDIKLGWIL